MAPTSGLPEKPSVRGIYRDTAKAPFEYTSNPNFEAVKGDVETGIGLDFTGSDGSNVEKLVVSSGLGARYKHGVGLARLNHETDRILKDAAREVTILQCTHFLEEWSYIFQMPLGDPPSITSWVAPADYKIAMVSIKDIAEVSVKSLLRDSQQPGFHCVKAMLGHLFPEHCIPDIVEVLEASLPGGLIATEYGYDENTFTGKVELVDVIRELHKKYNE
ncbi:hypothetical protein NXS19_006038 [Fusarium pseudograminearum]|nr:hypothetical protein NXS19_006038 [Fusarium pseudograminearum]